jgi:hypothetical protein
MPFKSQAQRRKFAQLLVEVFALLDRHAFLQRDRPGDAAIVAQDAQAVGILGHIQMRQHTLAQGQRL